MGVGRNEIGRRGAQVGEIAAPAPGNTDFFGQTLGMIKNDHTKPALARYGGRHHAGGAGADHGNIEM